MKLCNIEIEQCDICGRKCNGVYSNKIHNEEKGIQKSYICLKVTTKK